MLLGLFQETLTMVIKKHIPGTKWNQNVNPTYSE